MQLYVPELLDELAALVQERKGAFITTLVRSRLDSSAL